MEKTDIQGPQQMQEEWFDDLFDLLDRVFRSQEGRSMSVDFPFYLRPENAGNLFVCRADNRVVSHVGYLPVTLSYFGHPVKIGMIGAVATDPHWRGKGLATKTLFHAFEKARQNNICMFMISGDRKLYMRNGARKAGRYAEYALPLGQMPDGKVEIEKARPEDAGLMSSMHRQKPYRFIRPLEMWEKIIEAQICHNQLSNYWIARRKNRPVAYFTLPAGNLKSPGPCPVFEYGGIMEYLLAGLKKAAGAREDISEFRLCTYCHEEGFRKALECAGGRLVDSGATTLFLLDFERLLGSLMPYIEEVAGSRIAGNLSFGETEEGQFTIGLGPERLRVESREKLTDLLFLEGPSLMERKLEGKENLRIALEQFLPLTAPKYDMSYA